jgi:hypothetical protein
MQLKWCEAKLDLTRLFPLIKSVIAHIHFRTNYTVKR